MVIQFTNIKNTPVSVYTLPRARYVNNSNINYRDWLQKYCAGDVWIGATFLYFKNEKDAVLFKLSFD